jgi:hypothetical protein
MIDSESSKSRRDDLRRLAEAATTGPWEKRVNPLNGMAGFSR